MSQQHKLLSYYKPNGIYNYKSDGTDLILRGDSSISIWDSNMGNYEPTDVIMLSGTNPCQIAISNLPNSVKSFTLSFNLLTFDFSGPKTLLNIDDQLIIQKNNFGYNALSVSVPGVGVWDVDVSSYTFLASLTRYMPNVILIVDAFGNLTLYINGDIVLDEDIGIRTYDFNGANGGFTVGRLDTTDTLIINNLAIWERPIQTEEIEYISKVNIEKKPFFPISDNLECYYSLTDLNDRSGRSRDLIGYLDSSSGFTSQLNNHLIYDDIVSYYNLDSLKSSLGVDLTLTAGTPTFTYGKVGRAMLTSSNTPGGVDFGDPNCPSGSNSRSFAFWFKLTSTLSGGSLLSMGSSGSLSKLECNTINGKLVLDFGGDTLEEATTSSATVDGKWHHIVICFESGLWKLYIDGKFNNQKSLLGTNTSTSDVYIASYFDGYTDEFGVWSRSLSDVDVAFLYNKGKGRDLYSIFPYNVLPTNLENGLQAFYNLSDLSDASGNGNTLTNIGGVTFGSGKIGSSAIFNAAGYGGKHLATSVSGGPGSGLTVSMWVKVISNSLPGSLIQAVAGDQSGWFIAFDGASSRLVYLAGSGAWDVVEQFGSPLSDNVWYHIVKRADASGVKMYINGVEAANWANNTWTSAPIELGHYAYHSGNRDESWNGSIDSVGIWNRALTEAEVAALYNSGNGLEHRTSYLTSGLQAFYNLSDTSDSSGNGYDLTDVGGVTFSSGKIGNCAVFDGIDKVLKNESISLAGSSELTLSFWVRTSNPSQPCANIVGIWGNSNATDTQFEAYYESSSIGLIVQTPGAMQSPPSTMSIADGNWHHCVLVFKDGNKVYGIYDGVKTGINNISTTTVSNNSGYFGIGRTSQTNWCGANHFDGEFDAVGVWNRALSDKEVSDLYNSGNGLEANINNTLKKNEELHFNSGYLTIKDDISYDINRKNEFAISFIVKPDSFGNPMTIIGGNVNDISKFIISIDSTGNLYIDDFAANFITISSFFEVSKSCFVVITYIDNTLYIYKDGVLFDSVAYYGTFIIKNFSIGSTLQNDRTNSFTDKFDGSISDVCVWSRYLTPDDVEYLYFYMNENIVNNPKIRLKDGIMGLYKFTVSDGINYNDYSGRGKNLTYNIDGTGIFTPIVDGIILQAGKSELRNDNFNFTTTDIGEITISLFLSYYYNSSVPANILNLFGDLISIKRDILPIGGGNSWNYLIYCNGILIYSVPADWLSYFGNHLIIKLNRLTNTVCIYHNNFSSKIEINSLPSFSIVNSELVIGDIVNGNSFVAVDTIAIWNRGLNDDEISTLFNNDKSFDNFGNIKVSNEDSYYGVAANVKIKGNAKFIDNMKIIDPLNYSS